MRVLIVDDEHRARKRLTRMLRAIDSVDICGQAGDGLGALEAIEKEKPDVVLLDVQMPGIDGFEVLNGLRGRTVPLIIFVTAYDQYAVRAFEVSAVDYLLKPVSAERLQEALAKAMRILKSDPASSAGAAEDQLRRLAAALAKARPAFLKRLVARDGTKLCILAVSEVQAFVSQDELVFALVAQSRLRVNKTFKELEGELDPEQFLRVHKQAIVSLAHIAVIDSMPGGGALATLHCGLKIDISRRYGACLRNKLGW